ncbi:hypothetical protein ESZ53_05560 [Salinibacterium sp. UTAS2018]|uniref:hypothetical protein n=1 Tax=Salinibacterium sp. UTAS2018 TaxID=2508880 RepID=UPI00100958C3|nr:hypothetical protein [Salinibacterium sp. UTAS2018]QAV69946.1 hypothetical protein ESZ53_05560 [Salinibacterium sp. UTAS2018]
MRWDNLFDDLESQLEREITAEDLEVDAEEERLRLGRLSIRDRIVALHERSTTESPLTIAVMLTTGARVAVRPVIIGRDWMSADIVDETGRPAQCIIPFAALAGISLGARHITPSLATTASTGHPSLSQRLSLSYVLRDLCRRRRAVTLLLATGEVHGTIDRVGRDHLDIAVHERGAVRRETAVSEYRLVPFASLVLVRP